MRITNLNRRADIGANSYLVESGGVRLLLDAGMHPKLEGQEALPQFHLIGKEPLDAIVISHCHHDHIGALPVICRLFPTAPVFMSELSFCIAERVLRNSVNVMSQLRYERGVSAYPLFTHEDVTWSMGRWVPNRFFKEADWSFFQDRSRRRGKFPCLKLYDAGHVFGSAGIWLQTEEGSLFYTGDVCFHDQTIQRAARFEGAKADVLIIETTRGNRAGNAGAIRTQETQRLAEAIRRVLERKGCVLIPTFALGRTQEVLGLLALLMRQRELRRQPIYVGGLGLAFSEVYDALSHRMFRNHQDLKLNRELDLIVLAQDELERIRLKGGKIFVLTAGMMTERTAAHNLALRMMADERHGIFFVGYTDPETPGGRLKASKRGEPFYFSDLAGEVTRYCELGDFDLSAHADREALVEFVGLVGAEVVVLVHGEPDSVEWFKNRIYQRFPQVKVLSPGPGETVEI